MIGTELLDDPQADPRAVRRELRDIARLNALFGGTRAVVRALQPFFASRAARSGGPGEPWTLLDLGTGSGDVARAAVRVARRHGIELRPFGLELNRTAARVARAGGLATIIADGTALPVPPKSVDVVVASQVLHHLPRPLAVRWIASCDRVARRAVVLADLRRSRVAMAGVWLATFPLAMSRTTRRDAVLSLRRGYSAPEVAAMLEEAGVRAEPSCRLWFRIVAAWAPCAPSTRS
jgi:ubiquinone/menaquinone biosynthesis C-methylase UbiE